MTGTNEPSEEGKGFQRHLRGDIIVAVPSCRNDNGYVKYDIKDFGLGD